MGDLNAVFEHARRWIAHFDERGVPQGARVGAYGLDSLSLYAFWLGCAGSRRVPVLLNDKFAPENIASAFQAVPLSAVVSPVGRAFPVPTLGFPTTSSFGTWREPERDATALVVFTSGSSGLPKGVALSWGNLRASAEATAAFYGVKAGERWLSPLPLFHVGGFMVFARAWFTDVVPLAPCADESLHDVLTQKRPEWISLVPTQLARLIESGDAINALKTARGILLGGADTPLWLRERIEHEKLPVSYTYGMSEAASQIAATIPGEPIETMRVLPRREVRIASDGRLAFRGDVRFQGYWSEGRFQSGSDAEGWFLTQDAAALHGDGTLKILGRADEIFQCGGENIAPAQIERVLGGIVPDASFVVCPFPDPEYGFVPVLVVESRERPDAKSLQSHIQKNLSGLFRPRTIYWHRADEARLKPQRGVWRQALRLGDVPAALIPIG